MGNVTGTSTEPVLKYGEKLSDSDLSELFWDCHERGIEHITDVRKDADVLFDMYGCETLSPVDKQYLTDTGRPYVNFNYAARMIDTLRGMSQNEAQEPVWRGSDSGPWDEVYADWATRIVRQIRLACNAKAHASDAEFDMLISGYGYQEDVLDLTQIPPKPVTRHLQIGEVVPDPEATEENLADASFWIRVREWRLDRIQARWPDKKDQIEMAGAGTLSAQPRSGSTGAWTSSPTPRNTNKKRKVYEFLYSRPVPMVAYLDPETGEMVNTDMASMNARQKELDKSYGSEVEAHAMMMDPANPQAVGQAPEKLVIEDAHKYSKEVWYRAFLLGDEKTKGSEILEHEVISTGRPTIRAITGYKWRKVQTTRVRFFGPMRKVYNPQMYLDRSLLVILDILGRSAKGGGTIEEDAFTEGYTHQDWIKNQATTGYWHLVATGANSSGKIAPFGYPQLPPGYEQLFRMCVEAMKQVSLVTDQLMGAQTSERSNVFTTNMQEHSVQALSPIREPKTAAIQEEGKSLLALALWHLPAAELDKMLGDGIEVDGLTHQKVPDPQTGQESLQPIPDVDETGQPRMDPATGQPVPMTPGRLLKKNKDDIMKYKVVADSGAATANQKAAFWTFMEQHGLLDTIMKAGETDPAVAGIVLPRMFRFSPLPGTEGENIARELENYFEDQKESQAPDKLMQAFQGLDPQTQQGLVQQMMQMLQQGGEQQGAQGAPPPTNGSGPPQQAQA
jgi:hypothetical protein